MKKIDWLIRFALANALSNEDSKFKECWQKHLVERGVITKRDKSEKK